MRHFRLASLVLAGTFSLTGCADTPVEPAVDASGSQAAPSFALTGADASSKHLVVFSGKAPADFEQQVVAAGGTVVMNHDIGIATVAGLDDTQAAALQAAVGAQYVEPAPEFELIAPSAVAEPTFADDASAVGVNSPDNPAGAGGFFRQWNMRQVHADEAWAAGRLGSEDVTVAILDTGIDYLLPDMVGRVDLNRSVSFEPLDDLYAAFYFPGRHVSTDLHYHGTNVATQVSSNAVWYAGVTSKTTLMSVKVCSFLGGCHGVAEGILYAIDNGADVINMSLGGWFNKSAFPGAVSAYNRIMNYAAQNGVTVVVSAGNDANDLDRQNNIAIKDAAGNVLYRVHIPSFFAAYCNSTQVICVSATRDNDEPASYTNYGRSAISVAAPGGDGGVHQDWVYAHCPQTSLRFNCSSGLFRLGVAGTSQAAPHVSGLAALAVEDVGRNPGQVRAYISNSADAIGGGNTPYYGKGRINVARAVGAN